MDNRFFLREHRHKQCLVSIHRVAEFAKILTDHTAQILSLVCGLVILSELASRRISIMP